jgi:formate/nitrite transporter FocA (FNT family)
MMNLRQRLVFAAIMSAIMSAIMVATALVLNGAPLAELPERWIRIWPLMYPVAFMVVVLVAPPLSKWVQHRVK